MTEETQTDQPDTLSDDDYLDARMKGEEPAEAEPEKPAEEAGAEEPPKAEEEPEKPAEEDDGKPDRRGNPKFDPTARFRKITAARRQAEAEANALKQRVAELERQLQKTPSGRQASEDDPAPDPSKYPNTEDGALKLIEDRSAWAARQEYRRQREAERKAEAKATTQRQQEARAEHRLQTFTTQMQNFEEVKGAELQKDPQFLQNLSPEVSGLTPSYIVQSEGGQVGPLNVLADEIIRSRVAPALMRYFSEHEDALQRIAALEDPRDVVADVAIISTRLDAASGSSGSPISAKRASQPSKAPPPIKPVQGSPSAADPLEDPEKLSDDEYLSLRMKQLRERRTG